MVLTPPLTALVIDQIDDAGGHRGGYWSTYLGCLSGEVIAGAVLFSAYVDRGGGPLRAMDDIDSFTAMIVAPSLAVVFGGVLAYWLSDHVRSSEYDEMFGPPTDVSRYHTGDEDWVWSLPLPSVVATHDGVLIHMPLVGGQF